MKHRILDPHVTYYSSEDVAELLGPAQTQYCGCDVTNILYYKSQFEQELKLSIDTSYACGEFDEVKIEIFDGQPPSTEVFPYPGGGTHIDQRWDVTLTKFFTIQDPPSEYDLVVSFLLNGVEQGTVCRSKLIADPSRF